MRIWTLILMLACACPAAATVEPDRGDQRSYLEKPFAGAVAGGLTIASAILAAKGRRDLPIGILGVGSAIYLGISDRGDLSIPLAVVGGVVSAIHVFGSPPNQSDGPRVELSLLPRYGSGLQLSTVAQLTW